MIRIPGPIPITIYPAFWIFSVLIGYINSYSLVGTLIWVIIIFISVLFHEFGHALTAFIFGQKPRIDLVALGGLTYHQGQKLPFIKQFFIVLNGPLFGFLLFGIVSGLLHIPGFSEGTLGAILSLMRIINLFWTIVNLFPVMPLDGGQLLRVSLEGIFGFKGFKYAIFVSIAFAVGVSLVAFLYQAFLIGALFFLLGFQSYDMLRKTRHLAEPDRNDDLRELLTRAEEMLQRGNKQEAMALCEEIRKKTKKGIIYENAIQYLAFLKYDQGRSKETYELLLPLKDDLENETLCLLHKAAFDQQDFSLVAALAGACFQNSPIPETALRNAFAHAELKQVIPALGWLQTAMQEGVDNVEEIVKAHAFDYIRHDPSFQDFIKNIYKRPLA